jgi:flagellar hook assembly protein FlgD
MNSLEAAVLSKNSLLAYPNPFVGNIRLSFIPEITGQYNLNLYDINGKLVKSLYNKTAEKGIVQRVEWNGGSNMASGTYIVCLQTPAGIERQKIVLNR